MDNPDDLFSSCKIARTILIAYLLRARLHELYGYEVLLYKSKTNCLR